MNRLTKSIIASAATATTTAVMLTPASAAIQCNGRYQIVKGSEIQTPYCEDNYIAYVARLHGVRVAARTVRHNPNVKANVCRAIGSDIRVNDLCAGHLPGQGGFRRR